jgi:hypothetical protein
MSLSGALWWAMPTEAASLADQSAEGHQRQKDKPCDTKEDDAEINALHGLTTDMSRALVL